MDVLKLQKCVHRWFEFRRRLGLAAMDRREQIMRTPVTLPLSATGKSEQERVLARQANPELQTSAEQEGLPSLDE